jgi:sulfite exporter TauE/SafE
MNMTPQSFSAMDFIVLAALLFAIGLVIAWALSPSLRGWIERPKHRFLDDVKDYDRAQQGGHRRA